MTSEPPETAAAETTFEAAIFDLDGLLIDSEPLWRRAELEVFGAAGVALSEAECHQTTGLRTDQVVAYWFERRPWDEARFPAAQVTADINTRVIELIRREGNGKHGAAGAIDYFQGRGLSLGLASSSAMPVIDAAIERLGIADRFEVVHSADFEARSKPAPDVYLGAARRLGADPARCVAIEDSIIGLSAARSAGMTCVWVPEHSNAALSPDAPRADIVIGSLAEIDDDAWRRLVETRRTADVRGE